MQKVHVFVLYVLATFSLASFSMDKNDEHRHSKLRGISKQPYTPAPEKPQVQGPNGQKLRRQNAIGYDSVLASRAESDTRKDLERLRIEDNRHPSGNSC